MPFPELDPMDWRTIQPHVDALLAAELTPATADAWLQQWSDLASVLYEAQMRINRKVTENTADEEADKQFLVFVEQIMPQTRIATQALRDRLLALQAHGYTPEPDSVELLRRFRAEASIYRAENVPILSELLKLGNQFDKVEGGLSIVWNGATETIPQARLHWQSQDRTERETSWRLVMAAHAGSAGEAQRALPANAGSAPTGGTERRAVRLSSIQVAGVGALRLHAGRLCHVPRRHRARGRPAGAEDLRRAGKPDWGWARSGRGTPTSTRTASRCGRSRMSPIWKRAVTASSTRWIPSWPHTSP